MDEKARAYDVAIFILHHRASWQWSRDSVAPLLAECEAFFDPFFCIVNAGVIDGEEREALIGMTINWRLLYVVYTIRSEVIRIISVRLVTKHERKTYEEQ